MKPRVNKLGFWSIVLLTINGIIGTGIFLSPAGVIKTAGTLTPLIYILAAIFAGFLALTFASAAKYVNKNGAAYAYAKAGFGNTTGYYVGITRFTAAAIAWGVMATAVVRTTLKIFGGNAAVTQGNITIGFLILMAVLLLIIFSGTFITKIASNVSTIGKVLALLTAIVGGFIIFLMHGNHFEEIRNLTNDAGAPLIPAMDVTMFVGALLSAFYAYTGFESVASASQEMIKPEKNLPRAIPLAILIIAAIYTGVVSIGMVINPKGLMMSTDAVILASAYNSPFLKNVIIYGALVSMFGINIAAAFSTPRIFEAMADEGQLPQFLCKRTKKQNVPIYAFLVTAIMAIFVPMAFMYDMRGILIISSISRFIQFLVVPWAVVRFYMNKSSEPIIQSAKRNMITDVIVPIIAFFLSAFLLIKFNWVGRFSMTVDGVQTPNLFAIWAMIIGYVILPIVLYIPYRMGKYTKRIKE